MVEWKDIKGYEGYYQVSSDGKVRSLTHQVKDTIGRMQTKIGKILSPSKDGKGYHRVSMSIHGKKNTHKVHRLVAQAFILNPENKPEVNHKDKKGDKTDNRVENLEWATSKENWYHAFRTGLWNKKGENQNTAKLTEEQVLEIRAKHVPKYGANAQLAREYGVSKENIAAIVNRRTWKHI